MMATSTCTDTAIHTWDLTAFSEVPKKRLMRRCCFTHLKYGSTYQRLRYNAATVSAGSPKWLVRNTSRLPDLGSL